MGNVIVYLQNTGIAAVIYPTPDALEQMTIEEIAKKDVPTGYPYKIIDVLDVPSDRSERDGWTVDESDLSDGVGE